MLRATYSVAMRLQNVDGRFCAALAVGIALLLLMLLSAPAFGQAADMAKARRAYEAGDYRAALKEFNKAADEG